MITLILTVALAIWPFTPTENHSRNWYARRLHRIQERRAHQARANWRNHKTWLLNY